MARDIKHRENSKKEDRNTKVEEIYEELEEIKVEKVKYQDEIEEEIRIERKKVNIVLIGIVVVTCIFILSTVFYKSYLNSKIKPPKDKEVLEIKDVFIEKEKVLNISNSDKRIVAAMVSNEKPAWPQAGLQEAYMIYECLIEGGETRFMALFKENAPKKIGPIRSARHYFVNYLQEHDGIYAHFGWSPLAEEAIKSSGVNNINGIYDDYYYREGSGYNNAYSSMEKILTFADKKGYRKTTTSKPIYNYSVDEYYLETDETNEANNISINYSSLHNVGYIYNPDTKTYLIIMRGIKHIDKTTREQLSVKNIVVIYAQYSNLNDYSGSHRQELSQVGSGNGYYITNGRYIPITWNKSSKSAKTIIKDSSGNDITLNDGLTFIQVVPKENSIKITI